MDPKDLFDNAQNLDFAVNDITKAFWKDRFGRSRPTMFGIEQAFSAQLLSQQQRFDNFIQSSGYKVIGDYTAGPLTITEYNQLIRYQNEFYKLTAATPLDFTTTGNDATSWANDSAHFVSVGDAALRQQLAAPGGAGLVGPGVMTRGADKFSILQGRNGEQFGADATRGIGVHLAEPITGSDFGASTAKFNYIRIDDDRLNAVDDVTAGQKVDGVMVVHRFGGAGTKGGRHAGEFLLSQNAATESTNTDRNYVGLVGMSYSATGDGGVSGTPKGGWFGCNFVGSLDAGAMYGYNVTAGEFNVKIATGASAEIRTGIQIAGQGAVRGNNVDAGLSIGCAAGSPAWNIGLYLGDMNGGEVFDANSRAISVKCDNVDRILSLAGVQNCNHIIYHNTMKLTPKYLRMEDTAAYVSVGSPTTASVSYIEGRSSGLSAYDSRINFSGGSATAGAGAVGFVTGVVTYSCNQRPSTDNTYDYGAAAFRGRTAYFGTGTINTSDDRHKPIKAQIPDEVLDAWAVVDWNTWFKFDDAVAIKGEDGARWHFGLIAQRVEEVFAAHDIDGFSLGLLCYDEWEDQYTKVCTNEGATVTKTLPIKLQVEVKKTRTVKRPVMVKAIRETLVDEILEDGARVKRVVTEEVEVQLTEKVPVLLEDGSPHPQQPYVDEVVTEEVEEEYVDVEIIDSTEEITVPAEPEYTDVLTAAAGNRYGIRYEEALSLEAALQRRNYSLLLSKYEDLAARVELLEGTNNG